MLTYFDYVDPRGLRDEFPLTDGFLERFGRMSAGELRALQEKRFADTLSLAWRTPFYRRLWGSRGIEQGDINGLGDLGLLPIIDKRDLLASIEEFPPYGDFMPPEPVPVIVQTTSGTTGTPQTMLFGPRSREVQNVLLARSLLLQGLTSSDVVHSVYGFGMVNGGHYVREAITHYTGAKLLPAGTGAETRSEQQVKIMARFGATVLAGFGDYIRHLATVARDQGLVVGRDLPVRMLTGAFSRDGKRSLAHLWGDVPAYDWYGVADTGVIAAEGIGTDGLVVWEDAHLVEIVDAETYGSLPSEEIGDLVVTCLFKDDVYPVIRFNTHDLSAIVGERSSFGETTIDFRRISGFLGRSDNMVKFKGINVYPDAIGAALVRDENLTGEYACIARRREGEVRDLEVLVETRRSVGDAAALVEQLHRLLGVRVDVTLVSEGETAAITGLGSRQKPRRLVDGDDPDVLLRAQNAAPRRN